VNHVSIRLIAVLSLLGLACSGCKRRGPSDIRVANPSAQPYLQVVLETNSFGDLKPNSTSEYRHVEVAFPYPDLVLRLGTSQVSMASMSQGEPLGPGRYTYVLKLRTQLPVGVDVEVVKEP